MMSRSNTALFFVNGSRNFLIHRRPMAEGLSRVGWNVELAGPDDEGATEVEQAGFLYHRVALNRGSLNPLKEGRALVDIARLYRRRTPDIVHHFTIKPVLYGGIAARMARVPAVMSTITGLGYAFTSTTPKARFVRQIATRGYRVAFHHPNNMVIYQNDDDEAFFRERGLLNGAPSMVIPGSGIDTQKIERLSSPKNDIPVVAVAARMLYDKGIVEFVAAAGQLKARGVQARFVLIGDTDPGNPAAIPTDRLTSWQEESHVEWWGWREDIPTLLRDVDIACLPSYREGLPRFLLEAGACGRPSVATDAPGCRSVVQDGKTGFLVPPRDAAALADALQQLIADAALRYRMGLAARRRMEEVFDTRHVVKATLEAYERVLRAARA